MAVEIYSDGSVVMYDNGSTYDGNVGNLTTVCNEMRAKYAPYPVAHAEESRSPEHEKPLDVVVKPVDVAAIADSSEKANSEHATVASATMVVSPATNETVGSKESAIAPGYPENEAERIRDENTRRLKCVEISDKMLFEILKSRKTGKTLSHSWLHSMLINRHGTGYTFAQQKVRKRGGTIEDLFEKLRRTPRDQLFTEDAQTPYTSQGELEAEEASTTYRMKLLTGYSR
jgi:hypothetical protein